MFPGSSKGLTNDRWPNVGTTADNKSTPDEKRKVKTTWACNYSQKVSGLKCRRRQKKEKRLDQGQRETNTEIEND